jgi:predicted nucleic acid-binding protein
VPYVVVDTSVSLPATLSSRGLARKFWIVLAYGALTYEAEHLQLELDELSRQAEELGGRVGGLDRVRAQVDLAKERAAALAELLPQETPMDWVAIGSAPLFDEYERKIREIGHKLNPAVRESDAPRLRRQVEAVCPIGAPPFDPGDTPELTADRKDDPILYTALSGGADLLISDDARHLVPTGQEHFWKHGGRTVLAVTFDFLMKEKLGATGLDLDQIDGSWLAAAHTAT